MTAVQELVQSAQALPPLPETAFKLSQVMQDRYATTEKIESVVKYDQVVTATVLRVANSSFYAASRSVGSLRDAVLRLGSGMLFRVAMSGTMRGLVSSEIKSYGIAASEFWRHSVATGMNAQIIQKRITGEAQATTFTVGLLHDVGKVVMSRYFGERYDELFEHASLGSIPFCRIEKEVLGFDHAEAGAALVEHWNLPEELVAAIKAHHAPSAETSPLADIIHVADVISLWIGTGIGARGIQLSASADVLDRCGLGRADLENCAQQALIELQQVQGIFHA